MGLESEVVNVLNGTTITNCSHFDDYDLALTNGETNWSVFPRFLASVSIGDDRVAAG